MQLKIIDLVMQTIALMQMLSIGSPQRLVYSYTWLIALNAVVYSIGILKPNHQSAFVEVLIDSMYVLNTVVSIHNKVTNLRSILQALTSWWPSSSQWLFWRTAI